MKKYLVVVESPSKVSTIKSYLSDDYEVVASVGHIRQIKKQPGSVKFNDSSICDDNLSIPDSATIKSNTTNRFKKVGNNFEFDWEVDTKKLSNILSKIKSFKPTEIILGTDPDREGEAIAWSIAELIKDNKFKLPMTRMRFHEITKKSIQQAVSDRGELNYNLINAYLIRVGLDYEIGFTVSGVLRNKIKCFKELSGGRVQTPTLVAIVQRERVRKGFAIKLSYSIRAQIKNRTDMIYADLIKYKKEKCEEILDRKIAESILMDKDFVVTAVKSKKVKVAAPYPFITVSLQQECFNKLGFSLSKSMQVSQELFNKGFITYMRTDNYAISEEFCTSIHAYIASKYAAYKTSPRQFKNKVKNAQEAHECIRPTNITTLKTDLGEDFDLVYNLIHTRTVACQMADAIREQTTVIFNGANCELKHNFSKIVFKGFKALDKDEKDTSLNVNEGDQFQLQSHEILEHKTEPPARYSEATLVEMMKTSGIGRPSTYAGIYKILGEREFITTAKRQISPTLKGEIVSAFMESSFPKYSEAKFTDDMENILDEVSRGEGDVDKVLPIYLKELKKNSEQVVTTDLYTIFEQITKFFSEKKCTDCQEPMQIGIKFSPFYICKKCKKFEKFESEKLNLEETNFEVIRQEKYIIIKYIGKTIFLPPDFDYEITIDVVRFLVNLPNKLCTYENKNVNLYLNKKGFCLGCDGKYYSTSFSKVYKASEKDIQNIISTGAA